MFGKGFSSRNLSRDARLTLALLAAATASQAQSSGTSCSTAIEIDPDATHRRETSSESGASFYKVTPGAAGVLTLEVSAPGDPADRPVIHLLGSSCDPPGGEGEDFTSIRTAPTWVAVEVLAGEPLYFELTPENVEKSLPALKLRAAFVSDLGTPDEEVEPGGDSADTCGTGSTGLGSSDFEADRYVEFLEDIDEWDFDVLNGLHDGPGVVLVRAAGADLDAELFAGSACAESLGQSELLDAGDRIGAVSYAGHHRLVLSSHDGSAGEYTLSFKFFALCAVGELDDHGDGFLCATALASEGETAGEIANGLADDGDVFTFSLPGQRTIAIETSGDTDTYGVLYDKDGQRLSGDDDSGDSSNFRITKTLAAGRYFVRVEGAGAAEGEYELVLDFDAQG